MKMKKLLALALVAVLLMTVFVGCGNTKNAVSNAVDAVESGAGDLVDDAQSAVSGLIEGAEDKLADAASDVVSGAASMTDEARAEAEALAKQAGALLITEDELAEFDGKNGNKAYIAVNSIIYDVTDVPEWVDGEHNGFTAGKNVTDGIKTAPHNEAVLIELPIVGMIKA